MKQIVTEYKVNLPCGMCQTAVERTFTVYCSGACKVKASRARKIAQYKISELDPNDIEASDASYPSVKKSYTVTKSSTKKPVTNNYITNRSKFTFRTKACPKHRIFTCGCTL